jgi:hypothetical protein
MHEPLVAVVSAAAGGAMAGLGSVLAVGLALTRRRGRQPVEAWGPRGRRPTDGEATERDRTKPMRRTPPTNGQNRPTNHEEVSR